MAPDARSHRWRLDVAWDGRRFVGWQRQPNGPSLQGLFEDALARILGGEAVRVDATGRTDAGVHAAHQVLGFSCDATRDAAALVRGLNAVLPDDVACLDARPAAPDFDPRRWTRRKTYRYRVLVRGPRCPFRAGRVWHVRWPLDVAAMHAAAQQLVGDHDFSSFRAAGCGAAHPRRTLEAAHVRTAEDEVQLEFVGNGFLRHQVRIMTGSLVEVGRGRRPAVWVRDVLAACDRDAAGPTAPAEGLWLLRAEVGDTPRPPRGEAS